MKCPPLCGAVVELKRNGIVFESTEEILEDIARANDISPMDLYMIIKKFEAPPDDVETKSYTNESVELEFSGMGIGNQKLRIMCDKAGVELKVALQRLHGRGHTADSKQTLKKIGEENNIKPIDVLKIILVE